MTKHDELRAQCRQRIEELKQRIAEEERNIAAVDADEQKKPVQVRLRACPDEPWQITGRPGWFFEEHIYRPAPEPEPPKPLEAWGLVRNGKIRLLLDSEQTVTEHNVMGDRVVRLIEDPNWKPTPEPAEGHEGG